MNKPPKNYTLALVRIRRSALATFSTFLSIDMLGKLNVKKVRAAAGQVFEEPATDAFSPTVQIAGQCKPELEVLAKELGYSTTSTTEIESRFEVLVDLLAKA